MLETFGEETCRRYLADLAGSEPPELAYREHAAAESWDWEVDGRVVTIPDAAAVEVDRQVGGQTIVQEIHVAIVDGSLVTFIDCTGA